MAIVKASSYLSIGQMEATRHDLFAVPHYVALWWLCKGRPSTTSITNNTSHASYISRKACTLCNEVSDEGSWKAGNTSWQVGKRFKLWTKAKIIMLYKSVYESFQLSKAKKVRFQELNWLTIRNQLIKNKSLPVGE